MCDNCDSCPNQIDCASEADFAIIDALQRARDDFEDYVELDENGVPFEYGD